ncbi:hypothetical protein [Marinobacter fonticola]|uniref:hypothetical protein n=1 Tax=Marinobacter fonticola TaxID=2603215 RepID=UPI0011E6A058|nr:hypothetical protein [Marinobacter fonticola]
MIKRILLGVGVVAACTAAAVTTSPMFQTWRGNQTGSEVSQLAVDRDPPLSRTSRTTDGSADSLDRQVQALAIQLLENYGETIHEKRVQALLLELREKLVARYPDTGEMLFVQAIRTAFPDYAEQILHTVTRMAEYKRWLEDNRLALDDMSMLERNGTLWRKRVGLFGEDAELIWAEERNAWSRKQQQFQQTVERLNNTDVNSLDETLFQLQSALQETYDSATRSAMIDGSTVAQVYFGLDSVQGKLKDMSPEARQTQINATRRQLGYSEEQVQRLAEQDQRRNERWDNGHAYMTERRQFSEKLDGEALSEALGELRDEYFQHEAKTIRLEEEKGFFRYERPRYFGRN